jgi:spore coat polysaccharide biosynthesis protein SpsF
MSFKTEQEEFWAGEFGEDYISRNTSASLLAANVALFARALGHVARPADCIELGANVGMNLRALQLLHPGQDQHAVEINPAAAEELRKVLPPGNVHQTSLLDFAPTRTWGLVLVKGVLIHINPDWLPQAYDVVHKATGQWLLLCEYYSRNPTTISYRGHQNRLFKRDFCGEMMDRHPDMKLVDYGFAYHRDGAFPQDDITWFLLEKRA